MNHKREKGRNSVFELMRLVAMFMIILEHCLLATSLHGNEPLSMMDNISWFIEAFTVCAVNLFFLLTGYFLKKSEFKLNKTIGLWGKTIFYSIVIYIIGSILGGSFSIKEGIGYLFPVLNKKYWFMQTYLVLSLLSPYIKLMLDQLELKAHTTLIIIMFVFFSLHQTFLTVAKTLDQTQGYGIIWATFLLIVGDFLRKYSAILFKKITGAYFLIGYVVIACGMFVCNWLIVKFDIAQGITSRGNFYAYNSVSVFFESICLFCFFIKISEKEYYNKVINWLAGSVLAGYLISSHPMLLYPLWTEVFRMRVFENQSILYFGIAVVMSIVVLLSCILIDKVLNRVLNFFCR